MLRFATAAAIPVLLSACAGIPDVSYQYYPAKSSTLVVITQTVDCTKDMQHTLVSYATPAITTSYGADLSGEPYKLRVRNFDGVFGDTDIGATFNDDGRIKGVSANTTGQGQAILTSAMTLYSTVAKLGGNGEISTPKKRLTTTPAPVCTAVQNWGNGKPVTLVYTYQKDLKSDYVTALRSQPGIFPVSEDVPLKGYVSNTTAYNQLVRKTSDGPGIPENLNLHIVFYENKAGVQSDCRAAPGDDSVVHLHYALDPHLALRDGLHDMAVGDLVIPGPDEYCIPVPKSELFGASKLTLTAGDSGAVTQAEYSKTNGIAAALGTANTAVTTFVPAPAPAPVPTPAPASAPTAVVPAQ